MQVRFADKPRVLFVDDERRVLNSMRAMFRRDYELFLTTRGDEALRIIAEQSIDVLVADQRMPIMTGVELLSAARRQSPGTVRILLTGYSDPDAIEGAMTDGKVFRFLNKPCPTEELRKIIAEAVQIAREGPRATPTLVFDGTRTLVHDDEDTYDSIPGDFDPITSADNEADGPSRVRLSVVAGGNSGVSDLDATAIAGTSDESGAAPDGGDAAGVVGPAMRAGNPADAMSASVADSAPNATAGASTHEELAGSASDWSSGEYKVDDFTDTTTTEIVMSGETITVREPGDDAPLSYRAPPPYAPGSIAGDLSMDDSGARAMLASADPETESVAPAAPDDLPAPRRTPRLPAWAGREITRDSSSLLLYVIGFVFAVLAAAWLILFLSGPGLPESASPTTVQPAVPVAQPALPQRHTLAENLELGSLALDAGALIEPAGASALSFFIDARAQAPLDANVARGLERLAQQLRLRAQEQLAREDYLELLFSLDALAVIDAADPRLAALRGELGQAIDAGFASAEQAIATGQWDAATKGIDKLAALPFVAEARIAAMREALEAARERVIRRAAQPAAEVVLETREPQAPGVIGSAATVVAPPVEELAAEPLAGVDTLLATAAASFDAGRLIAPANDNALHYLEQVRQVEPDNPQLIAALREVANALVQRALGHARNQDWAAAADMLDRAESLDAASAQIVAAREQIGAARIEGETNRIVPLSQMQRRSFVEPQYPSRALRGNKEGWVLLTFTVLPDGNVADVQTEETSKQYGRQFARAAEAAVKAWQFEPRMFLGQPIAQRVRARVNFELDR